MKLALKVIPNAKKSEAVGWEEDPRAGRALKLRIAAPPVEGKANKAVVLFLSAWLDIPRSSISLLRGASSRLTKEQMDKLNAFASALDENRNQPACVEFADKAARYLKGK